MNQTTASPTLDDLFRRTLARQPNALALVDPPDKYRITTQAPKQLTYAQADRAIAALATHFISIGLPSNSVIAVQLPNTVEFVLTMLAAYRAGLVVTLLPQLWRHADLVAALNRVGARAVVTSSRIDGISHADLAMNAAAEAFSIRYVCGFGDDLPEGMASLDAVIDEPSQARMVVQDGRRAALITFDTTGDGLRAIPRTHQHMIAGGLAIYLESELPQGATILSTLSPASFAALSASLTTWLLSGGALVLHHPFDDEVLVQQIGDQRCDVLAAPANLVMKLAGTALLSRVAALEHVLALWRAPEQVATSANWLDPQTAFTDVYLFGEAGLFTARRGEDGAAVPILPGPQASPHSALSGAMITGEAVVTSKGTLGLRGPMVPVEAYAPPPPLNGSAMPEPPVDHADTGFTARIDRFSGALCITAPPLGIMAVGGYRFLAQDLQEWARRLGQGALLTALPDRMSGHRLAGRAADNARARNALVELGLNPLMSEAFRDRSGGP